MALALLLTPAACAPRPWEGGFESDNPASQLYAIRRAGQQQDRGSIPHLVEALESDDPAVRMLAIASLERITGDRHGYAPYAPFLERQAAVDRWEQAVRAGTYE